ncbi:MAG: 4-(cytidine 5'-diphospho)-2-C-methyl-D-erythritol kinase [Thermoguttaceae bacterium]|nr:4-(cytidine 5'-diphospho)-2-C-methyl-D-erythritol kinase [Thermoguttaceae bacterium]
MRIEVIEEGRRWRAWAPAKVNLFFEVLGKRPDGYHDIETVVAQLDLCDRLEFERTEKPGLELECFDEEGKLDAEIPCDERNLVAKAFSFFCSDCNDFAGNFGLKCQIFKKIPTTAGLGGGSSDAASGLSVFNIASGALVSTCRLQKIAGRVGSDVALFLEKGGSIGRGRGELVESLEIPRLCLVLLKPREGLSTPAVYRRYAEAANDEPRRSLDDFCKGVLRAFELSQSSDGRAEAAKIVAERLFNRLEQPASELWSGLEPRRELLLATGALGVQMSGSGTAIFAIYSDEISANRAALVLNEQSFGDRVYVVRTL